MKGWFALTMLHTLFLTSILTTGIFVPRIVVNAPRVVHHRHFFNSSLRVANEETRWTLNNVSFDAFAYKYARYRQPRTEFCVSHSVIADLSYLTLCSPLLFQVARGQGLDATQITHITTQGVQVVDLVINNVLVRKF